MTTKQLLERTAISEPTLRRWLKDGRPVPELLDCEQDWRGRRDWQQRHVDAIVQYKERKSRQYKRALSPVATKAPPNRLRGGGRDEGTKAKGDRVAQRRP
jgi:hypothetical protein